MQHRKKNALCECFLIYWIVYELNRSINWPFLSILHYTYSLLKPIGLYAYEPPLIYLEQ